MATSLATGLASFAGFRFALGLGESGNWPGATKAVSEWFPRRESGWAVALFDSGSSIGGALAPWIVLTIYHVFGSWRAFLLTGHPGPGRSCFARSTGAPDHPRLSADEREHRRQSTNNGTGVPPTCVALRHHSCGCLKLRHSVKTFTDPVWFFITDCRDYLVSKGLSSKSDGVLGAFLAADVGNFFGGGLSSHLIARLERWCRAFIVIVAPWA